MRCVDVVSEHGPAPVRKGRFTIELEWRIFKMQNYVAFGKTCN